MEADSRTLFFSLLLEKESYHPPHLFEDSNSNIFFGNFQRKYTFLEINFEEEISSSSRPALGNDQIIRVLRSEIYNLYIVLLESCKVNLKIENFETIRVLRSGKAGRNHLRMWWSIQRLLQGCYLKCPTLKWPSLNWS